MVAVTFPASYAQVPAFTDYAMRGRTYRFSSERPLYPFGFGRSYTTFAYRNLKTHSAALPSSGVIGVTVSVKNTGQRAGDEVVQLYVKHLDSAVQRPLKELADFKRVHLAPQQ